MKPYCAASAFSPSLSPRQSRFGRVCDPAWRNTGTLPCNGRDSGFLLLFLAPLLLLACLLIMGSHRVVNASQQRIAMQARLDICALSLIKKREALARALVAGNRIIRTTSAAIYLSRVVRIFTGPLGQVAGAMGEQTLLKLNRAAARWQDLQLTRYQAIELAGLRCGASPYSRGPALCLLSPPLASATRRKPAMMPDIAGPRIFLEQPLARADCRGRGARATLRLDGDTTLTRADFSDRYEK